MTKSEFSLEREAIASETEAGLFLLGDLLLLLLLLLLLFLFLPISGFALWPLPLCGKPLPRVAPLRVPLARCMLEL